VSDTGQDPNWGQKRSDHYGYASDEERLKKRGLEDWELVEQMDEVSNKKVPIWFWGVILVVILVAFGLTLPFWGDRPDNPRPWFTWGHIFAIVYFLIGAAFIAFMVRVFTGEAGTDDEMDKMP